MDFNCIISYPAKIEKHLPNIYARFKKAETSCNNIPDYERV